MTQNKSPLIVTQTTRGYWRVTFDNPPLNLFDPEIKRALQDLIVRLEADSQVKVVIFESADPDFFIAHVDLRRVNEGNVEPGPTGLPPWPDVALRLQRAPFLTIATVRGRARGVGNEFLLAMDIRFASREKAIFGQIEVGCGVIPGGGGLERLPRLIGRARAMEVIVGCDDIDADTAELYGMIDRAIPDAELDGVVDRFARRVDGFDRKTIALAKAVLNENAGLPLPAKLVATLRQFHDTLDWPATKAQIARLFERGLQQRGDFELRLGHHLLAER